ncbi:MAG: hypothetical protein IJ274_07900 [Lachnospiraceae bacterium]|nr:hypothetical protein [Lachnospiraceae bacterium]
MKKFKMSTSIIIIVISVAVIVGAFVFISNKLAKDNEPTEAQVTAVQNVLLRNMDNNYPPTPKEVLKYYSDITQCFYSNGYTEEEFIQLAERAFELYDEELKANQDYDMYIENLRAEIASYKEKDWSISSYSTSSSTEVLEFERDGDEWAQLYAFYNVRQSTQIVKVTEIFLLRKDENGRWKIYGWQQAQ